MVNNRASWKKHVYSDLQPYMCLWDSCPIGRRMFSTRHEWLQHEQNYHGKIRVCCLGCPDSFKDCHTMQDHYAKRHRAPTEGHMKKVMQASETRKMDSEQYTCPLCSATMTSMKAYAKHVGKYLRELALFALPVYPTEEEVLGVDSENESGHESEQEPEHELENEYRKELGIADDISDHTSVEFPITVQAEDLTIPSYDSDALQDARDLIPSQNKSFREGLNSVAIQREAIRKARKYAQEAARAETEPSAQATQSHSQIDYETRKNAEEEEEARSKKERELDSLKHAHSQPSVERTPSSSMKSTSLTDTDTAIPPAKTQAAYAGPTFHASPAPSSLPIPKFSSNSVPSKTRISPSTPPPDKDLNSSSSPTPSPSQQAIPIRSRHQDSPLNMFFEADRAERARNQEIEPSPRGNVNWGGVDRYKLEDANRRLRAMEEKLTYERREELTKRKWELEYLKDRQKRADEEARIKFEEERLGRNWIEILKKREQEEEEEEKQAQSKREYMDVRLHFSKNLTEDQAKEVQADLIRLRRQPTYLKVDKEHLDVETLRYYDIPYEIDIKNPDYIIILREMEPRETEILFEQTRRLRGRGGSSVLVDGPNEGSENEMRGQQSTRDGENQSERVVGAKEMFF